MIGQMRPLAAGHQVGILEPFVMRILDDITAFCS